MSRVPLPMGVLEAAIRGLACHCRGDTEGHEVTEHLTPGEREVFEWVRGVEGCRLPDGHEGHCEPRPDWAAGQLRHAPDCPCGQTTPDLTKTHKWLTGRDEG